jgi:hypothetical protein
MPNELLSAPLDWVESLVASGERAECIIVHSPRCWNVDVLRSAPAGWRGSVTASERHAEHLRPECTLRGAAMPNMLLSAPLHGKEGAVASERDAPNTSDPCVLSAAL